MEISHIDFYSGSKGEESPRKIHTSSGTITVEKIIETKLEEDFYSKERKKVIVFQSRKKDFYQLNIYRDTFEIKQIER
ncbi:hypothetical protein JW879_10700 [candidate division WOR-3 bacterium]|nr:hypothetical protein [candidate division WOR-3 bacterium]